MYESHIKYISLNKTRSNISQKNIYINNSDINIHPVYIYSKNKHTPLLVYRYSTIYEFNFDKIVFLISSYSKVSLAALLKELTYPNLLV